MRTPRPDRSNPFRMEDFPVLRDFLRGYFHQDWNDEYESPRQAVEQFYGDAGIAQTAKLAEEWEHLSKVSGGKYDATVELLKKIGGAWNPTRQNELDEISITLARYKGRSGRK
jgi:CdiI immunity protein